MPIQSTGEMEEVELSHTADGNVNWYSDFGTKFGSVLKNYSPIEMKAYAFKKNFTLILKVASFVIIKI